MNEFESYKVRISYLEERFNEEYKRAENWRNFGIRLLGELEMVRKKLHTDSVKEVEDYIIAAIRKDVFN